MIKSGFMGHDEFGLFPQDEEDNNKIPYYAIKLTPEQAKAVKNKIAGIYETDGKQLFEIKGDIEGEQMLYVVWI
jgi:hypothetical protein